MRFLLFFTTALVLFCSRFINVEARAYDKTSRPTTSLRPYSEGALLYRTEQLDPALMRRSPPEEVLSRYVKENQARQALLDQLTAGGGVDLFQLTSSGRGRRYLR